ncbi:MAG: DUF6364 family protein [Desulfococcaceae bacterium]
MQTEIRLYLDNFLLERAELYSEKIGKSLSQIIADYLAVLDMDLPQKKSGITPIVRSLKGCLSNTGITEDDYKEYLEKKYL